MRDVDVIEKKGLTKEQLDEIYRLAENLVKLFLLTREGMALSPGKDSLIERNLSNNRVNVQAFEIDPEYLDIVIAECCKAEAIARIATLSKVRCVDCSTKAIDCSDAQNPPALCANFCVCWNAQNFDEFGRDKGNLVIAKILAHKFL